MQAAAYDTLIPASREQLHRTVANALESDSAAAGEADSQQMARHWAAAGEIERALAHAKRASIELLMRSSHTDLVEHSRTAREWLEQVTEGPVRVHHELDLMLPYILALMPTRGYADESVFSVISRTEELLESAPDYAGAFNLFFAIGMFYNAQGTDRPRALRASERLATLVDTRAEYAHLNVFAWTGLANCHYADGNFELAQTYVEKVCGAYDRSVHAPLAWQFGFDAWAATLAVAVVMDWIRGDLDKSRKGVTELEAYAKELGHPESLAQVLLSVCILAYCRQDRDELTRASHELATLTEEHRLTLFAPIASEFMARACGDAATATEAVARLRSAKQGLGMSFHYSLLCEMELSAGNATTALEHVDQGIAIAQSFGERTWFPRLLCQRALVAHRLSRPKEEVEAALQAAAHEARTHGMTTFELEVTGACSMLAFDHVSPS